MQLDKFRKIRAINADGNIFDTGGGYWTFALNGWEALGELDIEALGRAAELGMIIISEVQLFRDCSVLILLLPCRQVSRNHLS